MTRIYIGIISALIFSIGLSSFTIRTADMVWGFYGHKKINRMAVFALPANMISFYKKNIEYVTEHAVDPDTRRYASKYEAIRHYIDIDHWDKIPFPNVPRDFSLALLQYGQLQLINPIQQDTIPLYVIPVGDSLSVSTDTTGVDVLATVDGKRYIKFFRDTLFNQYYKDDWTVKASAFDEVLGVEVFSSDTTTILRFEDRFSPQGILPYHLESMFFQLKRAFREGDREAVLRLSADYGHYIADAHVPLHTTENYNGQMTDQLGIHAFWESRLPELYAEEEYDFLVGQAEYIEKPREYFWNIVIESHSLLDSVLLIEKRLSETFPSDRQYCYDERLGRTVRIECEEYAAAYHDAMGNMVERRMQEAIRSVASVWYSTWVSAGQPDISDWADTQFDETAAYERNNNLGGGAHEIRE